MRFFLLKETSHTRGNYQYFQNHIEAYPVKKCRSQARQQIIHKLKEAGKRIYKSAQYFKEKVA